VNAKTHVSLGIVATLMLVLVDEGIVDGGMTLLVVVAALALASLIGGRRLPLFIRVFATGATFYLGYAMCLVGRTMQPQFTISTVLMALMMFGLMAALPTLALLRIWKGRLRVVIVASVFPVTLAVASTVAGYEEHQFIRQHWHGVGPTARWTVSNHWLAYDAEEKKLRGGD
jgi:hypothetical protein